MTRLDYVFNFRDLMCIFQVIQVFLCSSRIYKLLFLFTKHYRFSYDLCNTYFLNISSLTQWRAPQIYMYRLWVGYRLRVNTMPEHLNSVMPFSHGSPLAARRRMQHSQAMRSLAIRYLDCCNYQDRSIYKISRYNSPTSLKITVRTLKGKGTKRIN